MPLSVEDQELLVGRACVGVDPNIFFPHDKHEERQAKAICASCPCKAACLGIALRRNEEHGIWGGLTEAERRSLKRRQRRLALKEARGSN